MNLKVGSKVFYPTHGAGWVKDQKTIEFNGKEKEYFEFELINSQLSISTPIENIDMLGIRPVLKSAEIKDKISILKKTPTKNPKNKDFNDLLALFENLNKNSDIDSAIEVIQFCNYVKKKRAADGRLIPVTIENELNKAIMDIIGEMAVSGGIKMSTAAEQFIKVTNIKDINPENL